MKTIFLVRHGEYDPVPGGPDPPGAPLKAAGRQRAETLAAVLKAADVRHIFVTHSIRTQQTAQPLAAARSITPQTVDPPETLVALLRALPPAGSSLVVGHTNTLPAIIHPLGGPTFTLGNVFDNLFVLTLDGAGAAHLVNLKYGAPSP